MQTCFNSLDPPTGNPAVFIAAETHYAVEGTSTILTATVYGHPEVENVEWHFNGTLLDPATDARYSLKDNGSSLLIHNVEASVLGKYTIVARIGNQTASDQVNLGKEYTLPDVLGTR